MVKWVFIHNKLLNDKHYLEISSFKRAIQYVINRIYFTFNKYEKVLDKFDRYCSQYNDDNCDMIAYIARGKIISEGFRYEWTKDETKETIYLDFEDLKIPVPIGYKNCLKKRYGNYMEFPPKEKRGKWHEDIIIFDPDTPYKEYQKSRGWIE